jgi:hypothetical protein
MDERYKQYVGLPYRERIIDQLAEMRAISAKTFVDFYVEPRELFLNSLDNIAESSTKKLPCAKYIDNSLRSYAALILA